jgi:hypothetical protein
MSLEDLQSDIDRNLGELDAHAFSSPDEIRAYFRDTMYPLLASVSSELEDIDNDVADMVQQSEDILQPETAGLFAAVIVGAVQVMAALEKRLKANTNDNKWLAKIQQLRHVCDLAQKTLHEITVQPDADEPPDDAEASASEPDAIDRALSSVPASNENGDANVNG